MSAAARQLAKPRAADDIGDALIELEAMPKRSDGGRGAASPRDQK
jgi:hypothetical protein